MLSETVDSIIFDLDGTMWDSSDAIVEIWNEAIREFKDIDKSITKEELKAVVGVPVIEIVKTLFPYLKEERAIEFMNYCCKKENEYLPIRGGILFSELEETLKKLSQKYKLFIVSNCHHGYIEAFFHAHNMKKYFIDFEHPGRTGLTKGENIKLIINRNNLKNPMYVGDTQGDRNAARIAGIPFVYAAYGFGKVEDYDYKIGKFPELIDIYFR
ncbi:HAD family hydrolase [Clostridium subterminale]|uniref:HAD family hydrolase n=1 Tax=Clostridium subterminale TaxID=1550 RepID=A0ABN1KQN9_CLOSU